ncbi:MAG: hypothetical protein M1833_004191 [Piccolia ochrophora]|nr:MAG: hypothetical protein M1833_004191 [Piccolia ochrophora]
MPMAGSLRQQDARPLSVPEITQKAEDFEYNPLVPLRYWLRTADTLLKEAEIYEREGNHQQAYLLYFRHAKLILDNLVKHPQAQQPANRTALKVAKKAVPGILSRLDGLHPKVTQRFEQYERAIRAREVQRSLLAKEQGFKGADGALNKTTPHSRKDSLPEVGRPKPVAASENRDLAVKLAHQEIKRRELARKATRQAGISAAEEQERRAAGVWGDWEEALAKDAHDPNADDLQNRIRDTRRRVDKASSLESRFEIRGHLATPNQGGSRTGRTSPGFAYPSVPKPEHPQRLDWSPSSSPAGALRQLPTLPPKESFSLDPPRESASPDIPPPLPGKELAPNSVNPLPTSRSDPNPSTLTFQPSAYLENGTPLRTIFLPPDLRTNFLSLAQPNTRANLETCGILCGTLISNALFISRLVIPEQENTSDTCEMINEGALFDYCDSEELMVLGWIHTHPSQTCFMSSRDLHTHCGFQVMMPESIAIVCAPSKDPSWGVFRLTDPPGKQAILSCQQTGIFHPHAQSGICTDALRPGHVFEAKGLHYEVVDLRPGT